jgi:hydrogenase maturation protease
MKPAAPRRLLVIGLGNPLLSDDGVGPRILAELEARLGPREDLELAVDTHGGLRLMERLIGFERAVVIDATRLGGAPGAVRVFGAGELPSLHGGSVHDLSLGEALAWGRAAGADLPADGAITIVGVEAAETSLFAEGLTPPVAAAVPLALARVAELIGAEPGRGS